MTDGKHYSASDLSRWLQRTTSQDEAQRIESHLMECESCARLIDHIELPVEPIVQRLRNLSEKGDNTWAQTSSPLDPPSPQDTLDDLHAVIQAMSQNRITESEFLDGCRRWNRNPEQTFRTIFERWNIFKQEQDSFDPQPTESLTETLALSSEDPGLRTHHGSTTFRIQRLISTGGHGRIWLAEEKPLGRMVALKELPADIAQDPAIRNRFRREAMITAQLAHPGTVPLYLYEDDRGQSFYTMKFVDGRTFADLSDELNTSFLDQQELPFAELFRLLQHFVRVCDTIAYSHAQGILHRDLKGDNIVVGDFGEVMVLDWGIAKRVQDGEEIDRGVQLDSGSAETLMGKQLGTPGYMAPEQALGRIDEIDQRTDTYGLAAVLYEILTGRPPFRGRQTEQILTAVVQTPPIPPTHYVPALPQELETICLKGLSKVKADRYATAHDIGREVERWMASQLDQKRSLKEREKLFQLSKDLLAMVDRNGVIQQINPACEAILGWKPEEMIGRSDRDLVHPDHHAEIDKHRELIRENPQPIMGLERKVLCKDGSFRWLAWNVTPVPEESVLYFVARDITDYKTLSHCVQGLLDSMNDPAAILDENSNVHLANQRLSDLLDCSPEDLRGRFVADLFTPDCRDAVQQAIQCTRQQSESETTDPPSDPRTPMQTSRPLLLKTPNSTPVAAQAIWRTWESDQAPFLFITLVITP